MPLPPAVLTQRVPREQCPVIGVEAGTLIGDGDSKMTGILLSANENGGLRR